MAVYKLLGRLESDHAKEFYGPGVNFCTLCTAVTKKRPDKVMGDRVHGIKRAKRILENHLDPAPVAEGGPPWLTGEHVSSIEPDLPAVGVFKPHDKTCHGALAASRLSYKGDRLAPVYPKRYVFRGRNPATRGEEPPGQKHLAEAANL